jgi:hypothetical protein
MFLNVGSVCGSSRAYVMSDFNIWWPMCLCSAYGIEVKIVVIAINKFWAPTEQLCPPSLDANDMVQVTVKNGVYFLNVRCSISETSLWRLLVLSPDKQINVALVLWDACYRNTGFPFVPVIIGTVCHIEGLLMGRLDSACMLCHAWWSKSLNEVCHFWHPQRPSQGKIGFCIYLCKAQWSKSLNEVQSMTIVAPFCPLYLSYV